MDRTAALHRAKGVASLDLLTGPNRGRTLWVTAPETLVGIDDQDVLYLADDGTAPNEHLAQIRDSDGDLQIEAIGPHSIWVNGDPALSRALRNGDTIEFGHGGPIARLRLHTSGVVEERSVETIASDFYTYLRVSRRPLGSRLLRAFSELARRLVSETTVLFRLSVVIALVALALILYRQHQVDLSLQQRVERGASEIAGIGAALSRTRAETLRQSDLNALKLDLERQVGATVRRLEELERQGSASARVIANAAPAVVLLQGGYGLREIGGERLMRLVLTEEGLPIMLPTGQPLMSLDGDGPVAEVNYVSTGFLVGSEGAILTNRHVALPWESTVDEAALASSGLQPVMLKLIAYLPGHAEAAPVTLIGASERADLAVLKSEQALAANVGLPLAQAEPAAGEPIIVMGYPTGLKSILAQAGRSFVEKLQTDEDLEFWRDAETTHGGSGGPVLTMEGEVIAVTMAVLPEYGGSNLGVPIAEARRLLAELGLD